MKKVSSVVLSRANSSTGTRPPHHSAARTDVVLLIRRTVRPRGYASGFALPAALLDDLFDQPPGTAGTGYSFFNFFLISSAPYRPESNIEPKAGPMRGVP